MYTVYVYIYVYTQVVLANSYQCFNDIHDMCAFITKLMVLTPHTRSLELDYNTCMYVQLNPHNKTQTLSSGANCSLSAGVCYIRTISHEVL